MKSESVKLGKNLKRIRTEKGITQGDIVRKLGIYEAFLNRIDAKNREEYLKGEYGRKTIKAMMKKYLAVSL